MNDLAFFWALPAFVALVVVLELRAGRIPLYWTARGWHIVEKEQDEGRFWLFIVAEVLLMLILISQAISKS